jgi:hypothetical protein
MTDDLATAMDELGASLEVARHSMFTFDNELHGIALRHQKLLSMWHNARTSESQKAAIKLITVEVVSISAELADWANRVSASLTKRLT